MGFTTATIWISFLSSGVLDGKAFSPYALLGANRSTKQVRWQFTPLCARSRALMMHDDNGASSTTAIAPRGSWGSWTKQVSQSEEQERILRKISESKGKSGLLIRTGTKDDMFSVTRLCVDTFRGPFEWWMLPVQLFQEFSFLGQINARLGLVKRNAIKHAMVVAEDTTSRGVVGFLEIGMLPPPTISEESTIVFNAGSPSEIETIATTDATGGTTKDGPEDAGPVMGKPADSVYLANVVVDRNRRRRGIGRKMIASALELVKQLWPEERTLYVTVEKDNEVAFALYQSIGFERAAVEDDELARRRRRKPRVYLRKDLS